MTQCPVKKFRAFEVKNLHIHVVPGIRQRSEEANFLSDCICGTFDLDISPRSKSCKYILLQDSSGHQLSYQSSPTQPSLNPLPPLKKVFTSSLQKKTFLNRTLALGEIHSTCSKLLDILDQPGEGPPQKNTFFMKHS